MSLSLGDAVVGLLAEIGSLWRTILTGIGVFGLFAASFYVWLVGVDISVRNNSSRDLSGVRLLWYATDGSQGMVWTEDLQRGETKWRYLFTGARGVTLHLEFDGTTVRQECDFDSKGIGRSILFGIKPDGTISCEATASRI